MLAKMTGETANRGRLCPQPTREVKGGARGKPGNRRRPVEVRGALTSLSASLAFLVLTALSGAGCVVDHHDAPVDATTIELGEVTNLGYVCGDGADFSWTVTARETEDSASAECQQPIDFVGYPPGSVTTFDITGYDGTRVCWQGTCAVTAQATAVTYADCSAQIDHLCGW